MRRSTGALLLYILLFEADNSEASPLTMGFGKTLHLHYNKDQFSPRAFDFNIFPESGDRFEDQYIGPVHPFEDHHVGHDKRYHPPRRPVPHHRQYLEIDLKYAKKKPIPGVRHLFCSGHYCAFEYSDHTVQSDDIFS